MAPRSGERACQTRGFSTRVLRTAVAQSLVHLRKLSERLFNRRDATSAARRSRNRRHSLSSSDGGEGRGENSPKHSRIEPPNHSSPGLRPPSPLHPMERRGQGEERLRVRGEKVQRFFGSPLSSVLSPLLRRGARKKTSGATRKHVPSVRTTSERAVQNPWRGRRSASAGVKVRASRRDGAR